MTLRVRNGLAEHCWAHLGDLRCEKAPGHWDMHAGGGARWEDHGMGPAVDVDGLDTYGDAS